MTSAYSTIIIGRQMQRQANGQRVSLPVHSTTGVHLHQLVPHYTIDDLLRTSLTRWAKTELNLFIHRTPFYVTICIMQELKLMVFNGEPSFAVKEMYICSLCDLDLDL